MWIKNGVGKNRNLNIVAWGVKYPVVKGYLTKRFAIVGFVQMPGRVIRC